jgi:hypothetical protein
MEGPAVGIDLLELQFVEGGVDFEERVVELVAGLA